MAEGGGQQMAATVAAESVGEEEAVVGAGVASDGGAGVEAAVGDVDLVRPQCAAALIGGGDTGMEGLVPWQQPQGGEGVGAPAESIFRGTSIFRGKAINSTINEISRLLALFSSAPPTVIAVPGLKVRGSIPAIHLPL